MASQILHATLAWLLLLVTCVHAQTIAPSNDSSEIPPAVSSPRFWVNATGVPSFLVVPLGWYDEISHPNFISIDIDGSLVLVGQSNVKTLSSGAFDFISCDPSAYTGVLSASDVFQMTASSQAGNAIILYSTTANHCNASELNSVAVQNGIFSTLDPVLAGSVAKALQGSPNGVKASILPDKAAYTMTNSSTNNPQQYGSPGPTTAVAMIVLYTITGIITALFIVIIVTGAVRAHRHPERYGPRNIVGRPRQSRAKGIARAMLETLPIIKFGDNTDVVPKPAETDVEMTGGPNKPTDPTVAANDPAADKSVPTTTVAEPLTPISEDHTTPDSNTHAPDTVNTTTDPSHNHETSQASTSDAASGAKADGSDQDGSLGCSICTEDFQHGEDIRVLPCNHKFHPDCVDPWLLNVSGTCPLCRIDLNGGRSDSVTSESGQNAEGTEGESGEQAQLGAVAGVSGSANAPERGLLPLAALPAHRRETIRNLRRVAGASREERVAALRRLRQQRRGSETHPSQDESRGLSARLRERFRIRTRRQGEEGAHGPVTVVQEEEEQHQSAT